MITELAKRKWACEEKASLAFGVVNIIASVTVILAALVPLITGVPYINFILVPWIPEAFTEAVKNKTFQESFEHDKELAATKSTDLHASAELLVFYALSMLATCVVIAVANVLLMFSALLVVGVCQKRAGFIKAFFYYGVFTLPIALLLNVVNIADCIAKGYSNFGLWIQVGIFLAYMIFMIQLVIVRKTFRKLEDPDNIFAHTRLQESVYPTI